MFTITAITHSTKKVEYSFIDNATAMFTFKNLVKCCDAHKVEMIDGLTGEVLWCWVDGDYEIANGVVLR